MQYMLLMITEEKAGIAWSHERDAKLMADHKAFRDALVAKGKLLGACRLHPERTAVRVRLSGDKRSSTEGPFAETREVVGGFYVVEAESPEEALQWAEQCPSAALGPVEVRPLYGFDDGT